MHLGATRPPFHLENHRHRLRVLFSLARQAGTHQHLRVHRRLPLLGNPDLFIRPGLLLSKAGAERRFDGWPIERQTVAARY